MNNDTIIKVTNRSGGSLGYSLPELAVKRYFTYRETKEITFQELKALYNSEGGANLIKRYLAVKDKEAVEALGFDVEPEYFYTEEDVIRVMETGSLDEFLDMLDFAPEGILEMVKTLAVSRELNDMNKRTAFMNKTGYNITRAINIKNTNFDNGDKDETSKQEKATRRVGATKTTCEGKEIMPIRRVTK